VYFYSYGIRIIVIYKYKEYRRYGMLNENIKNRYKFILSKMVSEGYNAEGDWEQPDDVIPTTPGGDGPSVGDIIRYVQNKQAQGLQAVPGSGTISNAVAKGTQFLDGATVNYYIQNPGALPNNITIVELPPAGSGRYVFNNANPGVENPRMGEELFNPNIQWPDDWPLIIDPITQHYTPNIPFERFWEIARNMGIIMPTDVANDPNWQAGGRYVSGPQGILNFIQDYYKFILDAFGPINNNYGIGANFPFPRTLGFQLDGMGKDLFDSNGNWLDNQFRFIGPVGKGFEQMVKTLYKQKFPSFPVDQFFNRQTGPLFGSGTSGGYGRWWQDIERGRFIRNADQLYRLENPELPTRPRLPPIP